MNGPIEIRAVGNGFMVSPVVGFESRGMVTSWNETRVFQTMSELLRFVESEFTHRCGYVRADYVDPALDPEPPQ